MLTKSQSLLIMVKPHLRRMYNHQQCRSFMKLRLKWVRSKTMDAIIDKETEIKAAMLLKDAIKRTPSLSVTSKTVANWQEPLGLTFPVVRFLRRYPTLFRETRDSRFKDLRVFRLTDLALMLDEQEQKIYADDEECIKERLCRFLMLLKSRSVPTRCLYRMKWELGLPDRFDKLLPEKYPDWFRVELRNGLSHLSLVEWRDELAVSALERNYDKSGLRNDYREFREGRATLSFPMSFPKAYGDAKWIDNWTDKFQKLPYISPYDDCSKLDPNSDIMAKRNVGMLHELLSLTIPKRTQRDYLRVLKQDLSLPARFAPFFFGYPGIFYLSFKCKARTITLKEGYKKFKLLDPHPLTKMGKKVYYVMRTGIQYRARGLKLLTPQNCLRDAAKEAEAEEQREAEDEEEEEEGECWETQDSDMSDESDLSQ